MGGLLKKITFVLFSILVLVSVSSSECNAGTYIDTYYQNDKTEEISKGVSHISGVRLTNRGIVKTEIVKIDLSNKNIKFENVFNSDSMGAKTTLKKLIANKNNVVAAVNGDFFEISLTPSFDLGVTINDGEIQKLSSGEYYNCYSDSLASLLLDNRNNPNITFIKTNVVFENDNDSLYVSYYNKSGDKEGTVILDGDFFSTTRSMDNRNPNCYKLVVKKGSRKDEIIDILEPGTTIDITSDIYVVFLPVNFNRIENFNVGDDVKLNIDLSIDDDIETAIGGAGVFLNNGQIVSNGYIVSGYTARSFVGFDSRKKNLYIGTVGGLTSKNSGISSNQLGEILQDYDVYTAMHLDGGGSSTLMTKSSFGDAVRQVNDVASQRAIINALVVSNEASKTTRLNGIKLDVNNKALLNVAIPFKVFGYDENHKETSNKITGANIKSDKDIEVDTRNNTIIFKEKGRTNLEVSYSGYTDKVYVDIYEELSEIQVLPDPIILDIKEEIDLQVIAFTNERYKIPIDLSNCDVTIKPSNIAKISNGKIIGKESGVGIVTVSYDGLSASSIISVGKEEYVLDDFEYDNFESLSYPESVVCDTYVQNKKLYIEYEFEKSDETQAAYAKYKNNLLIPKGTSKIIFNLKGDGKGFGLKFKFVDSNGTAYNVDACQEMTSKSNKEYELELPSGYSGNLYLERYYVVALSSKKAVSSSICIDDVRCIKSLDYSSVKCPKSVVRTFKPNNESIERTNENDIIFYNNSNVSLLANYLDFKVKNALDEIENKKLVLAKNTERLEGIVCNDGLKTYKDGDTLIISMSTIAGSAFSKDPYQYGQMESLISKSDANNVIITLDGDLTSGHFPYDKEMINYILTKCYEEKRINFYVVMFEGTTTLDMIENGIRYIKVPSTISDAFMKNVLVMRKNENDVMTYNFISIENFIKEYDDLKEEINENILNDEEENDGGNDEE